MQSPENSIIVVFILILVLLGVFLVLLFLIFIKRKNVLLKENLESALANQKKQHELELKALRGQMNPHFVHNSLNAIQYYIQKNDVETSEKYLAKFSKLMRLFFNYSRQQNISLREEIQLLENYLQIEKLRFEESLEYAITVDPKLDIEDEQIPSMLIQPLVENAINHGLFHKEGKGHVQVQFNYINNEVYQVCVIDDGIGINKSKTINSTITKHNESHSATVIEERIHFFRESGQLDVDYSIEDRSLKENETGTIVTLTFKNPLCND